VPQAGSIDPTVAPHVALLLPTGSEAFARPAEAVRAGFLEAFKKQATPALPVRLYPVSEDPQLLIAAYRQALAAGAQMVVGPLTRDGVTALAAAPDVISVPTLALNVPEGVTSYPPHLYTMSLQVEAEARQAAQLALNEGRRKALTISDPTAFGRRMREAFVEEFERGGGFHIADYAHATDPVTLERVRQASGLGVADMVFFAVDASRARAIRPYVARLAAYGTSQLNPGGASGAGSVELDEVRFVDMPWMVQPEHPAVMVYSRPPQHGGDDLERLYALGIDAFRVSAELLAGKREIDVDGVTGHLTLGPDRHVRRSLLVALVSGGRLTVLGESRP